MEKLIEIVFTDPAYSDIRLPVLALGAVLALLSIVTKLLDIGYRRLERKKLEMELAGNPSSAGEKGKVESKAPAVENSAPVMEEKREASSKQIVLSEDAIASAVMSAIVLDFKKLSDFSREIGSVDLFNGVKILQVFAGFYLGLLLSIPTIAGTALIAIPVFGATCHLIDSPPFNFFFVLPVLIGISAISGFRAALKSGKIVGSHGFSDSDTLQTIQVRSIRLGALFITAAPVAIVGAMYAIATLLEYTS